MKVKIKSLARDKRVYYFDHRHGVLKNKVTSRYHLISGLMMATVLFGGVGFASDKVLEYRQQKQSNPTYQRQEYAVGAEQAIGATDDLQDAVKKAREDAQLAHQIEMKLKNVPGGQDWSVYVRDLNSDSMASINADEVRDAAGLEHIFLTAPLDTKIESSKWEYYWSGGRTLSDCVISMIAARDADCARHVGYFFKQDKLEDSIRGLGFKKTEITKKEQKTSAREMGELLFRLQNGQVVSDKARRMVFDGLYGQQSREGIPAGCDAKCLVANTTGESDNVRHDAAIVTSGDSKYVVVVMTEGALWSQIADVSSFIRSTFQP